MSRETMPRRADSRDVAARAGVSRSTVSKVLNGREGNRIPMETRQRVLQAVRDLNYVRNNRAHALVTGRTQRIGVVLNHPNMFASNGDYHRTLLSGVMDGVVHCNYNLLLHSSGYPHWRALYDDIVGGSSDGVIVVGDNPDQDFEVALVESGFPTVFVSHVPETEPHYVVDCDNVQGGYLAAQHLLTLGHRHLLFVIGLTSQGMVDWQRDRVAGFEQAIAEVRSQGETATYNQINTSHPADVVAYLKRDKNPTAIFVLGDEMAVDVLRLLLENGIRVPDDVSLMNFNSTEICEKSPVKLTSIYQPLRQIGRAAVDMLTHRIEDTPIAEPVIRFPVRLDVRASTAPPPVP